MFILHECLFLVGVILVKINQEFFIVNQQQLEEEGWSRNSFATAIVTIFQSLSWREPNINAVSYTRSKTG